MSLSAPGAIVAHEHCAFKASFESVRAGGYKVAVCTCDNCTCTLGFSIPSVAIGKHAHCWAGKAECACTIIAPMH